MLYINFSVKPLNFAPKFSAYFGGHFCYHSNGKSQSNLRLLHFGNCSNKLIRTSWWNHFYRGGGGQKKPLNARSSFKMPTYKHITRTKAIPALGQTNALFVCIRYLWRVQISNSCEQGGMSLNSFDKLEAGPVVINLN